MKDVSSLKKDLAGKLKRRIRPLLLSQSRNEAFDELSIPLTPAARDFGTDIGALKRWCKELEDFALKLADAELVKKQVAWKSFGFSFEIPVALRIKSSRALFSGSASTPCSYAAFLQAVKILAEIDSPYKDAICEVLSADFTLITGNDAKTDAAKLCALVEFLIAHPHADCYIREIPVLGLDTKWFEKHRAMTAQVLSKCLNEDINTDSITARWNFKAVPTLMRVRHANCFLSPLSCDELVMLPASVLSRQPPRALVVIENIATGMSIDVSDDIPVILGLGRDVTALNSISWIKDVPLLYMGDLDAHGLLIVSELRAIAPGAKTVMMDMQTLGCYQQMAGADPTLDKKQSQLPALTNQEEALYQELLYRKLRLEQERIPISVISGRFQEILNGI